MTDFSQHGISQNTEEMAFELDNSRASGPLAASR